MIGLPGRAVGIFNSNMRAAVIPVVPGDNDGLPPEVVSSETKVVRAERAVNIHDFTEVADNVVVIANLVAGEAPQVTAEAVETRMPLLEHDGLGFNFADLLGDDPLGHLLKDDKLLLDDFDALRVADDLMFLLDNLFEVRAIEVVCAIEVIKVGQRSVASPVVEGAEVGSDGQFIVGPEGYGSGEDASCQSGKGNE